VNTSWSNRANRSENRNGLLFILPQTLGVLLFGLIPVAFSLYLSFTDWDFLSGLGNIKPIGIKNFVDVWTDTWFTDSMKNTLIFSFATVLIQVFAGLILATVINRGVYFSGVFKTIAFIPYFSSVVALAVVFMAMFHPTLGPVNSLLSALGVKNLPGWFGDPRWALLSLILLTVWKELGYYIIVFTAGLKTIPRELYEAAGMDGAGALSTFRNVTLPMISPTTFFLVIMGIIGSFKVFDQIAVTTQGGPGTSTTVLVYYIYKSAFQYYRMGYASAIAWYMFLLIFIITVVQWVYQKRWVSYD
jgi:multiple sugar transport system permease protein